jgi:hypothetical protein
MSELYCVLWVFRYSILNHRWLKDVVYVGLNTWKPIACCLFTRCGTNAFWMVSSNSSLAKSRACMYIEFLARTVSWCVDSIYLQVHTVLQIWRTSPMQFLMYKPKYCTSIPQKKFLPWTSLVRFLHPRPSPESVLSDSHPHSLTLNQFSPILTLAAYCFDHLVLH